ncbi:MAG TPA: PAS domain S-box protein [Chitinophagaceae bacterium]|nr:PAS domain S-box protein [Chitinophagaceae bacterium]
MNKRYLKTLPILILLLAFSVVFIIFYSVKRSNKEDQIVTLVDSSWKFVALLNNLQNSLQSHSETIAYFAHGDNKGDSAMAGLSEAPVLRYLDSAKNIYKTVTELQPYIDSLTFYVNKRVDLSRQIITIGKEKGIKAAETFFINAPASDYSDKAYSAIRRLQLKTLQKLAQDEAAVNDAIKQQSFVLTIIRLIALALTILIVRNFFLDFSVRKRLEKQLKKYNEELQENVSQKTAEIKKSEERYRILVEQASDAIIINDAAGNLLDVNDNACNMLGYTKEELCAMNAKELMAYENDQEFNNVSERLARGESTTNERKIKRQDGSLITIETHAKMLSDGRIMSIVRDITQRKRIEEALRASEFNNRMVIENRILGVGWASPEGVLINANQSFCDMMGYDLNEIKGLHFGDFTHPDDVIRELDLLHKMSIGEINNYVIEKRYRKKNGNYFWVELNLTCYRNPETRNIEFFIGLIHDIQEQKQFEEALKASEKKLRQVLSSYGDVFYVIDKNYEIILINEIAERNLSIAWGKPVYLGANLLDMIPAQSNEPIKSSFEKVFRGDTIEYELNTQMPGLPEYVWVTYHPVKDYDGSIVGAYVITKDISERKKVEEDLRQSINRFEMISRTTNDAIWEWELETGRLWGNETHQNLYGLNLNDPVPNLEMWAARIHPDDREKIVKKQQEALASDINVFISEYRFNVEGKGYRDIYDRCYIVRNTEGKAIRMMGSLMDITERKQAEAAIKESEAKYRAFFESSMDGILLTVPDGRILAANPAACQIFRMTEAEICAAGRNGLIDPNDPNISAYLAERERTGKVKGELIMLRKDGTKFVADITTSVFKDALGEERTSIIIRDISDRKKMEQELQEAEAKFRNLVEQSLVGVYILQDGKYVYVNPRFAQIFGYEREELTNGFDVQKLIHPDYRALISENIRNRIEKKQNSVHYEAEGFRKHGESVQIEIFGSRTEYQGRPAIIGTVLDISHRKKAEREIRAVEETRRLIMDSSMDAIVCMDKEGLISVWTPQSEKIFGWKEQEVIGKKLSSVIIPEQYRDKHEKGMQTYLKTGKSKIMYQLLEFNALKKDGAEFPVEVSIVPVKQDDREFFCGFIRDITERKKAEAEIKKAKDLSDHIINNLPGVFYLYDQDGNFLRWNKRLETITGYESDEIARMLPWQLFEGDEVEYIINSIQGVFISGSNDAEAHFVTKDNKRIPFYFNAVRIDYENKPCLLGYGLDISDRKKAEEELEESYIAIRHLSEHLQNIREEERTHIAREIHDELGQQLTVLKMDASWLNKKLGDADEKVKHKLKDLLELMDSTVKTVRRISSELRPSLLDDMGLVPAMEWHLKEFEKRVAVKTHFKMPSTELNLPEGIKTGLFRIFQESLTNVARHANAKKVDINLQVEKEKIVLSIKDDGKGFEMEQAKAKKTLGILGMRERSYMMGGNYEVKSKPGKGTKVIVSVPYS